MHRDQEPQAIVETDPRFPSGAWEGFYVQQNRRTPMELHLRFRDGLVDGGGRDRVGPFSVFGDYATDSGRVRWSKQYPTHRVEYDGNAESKHGMWGLWMIQPFARGGFQIWPEGSGGGREELSVAEEREAEVVLTAPDGESWLGY